jgi:hypothetical protein
MMDPPGEGPWRTVRCEVLHKLLLVGIGDTRENYFPSSRITNQFNHRLDVFDYVKGIDGNL